MGGLGVSSSASEGSNGGVGGFYLNLPPSPLPHELHFHMCRTAYKKASITKSL